MRRITDFLARVRPGCEVCLGGGLVCEEHPLRAWDSGDGCCGAAGMPCRCTEERP
jgi:hypothetical protein